MSKRIWGFRDDEVLTVNGIEVGRINAELEIKDEMIRRLNSQPELLAALKRAHEVMYENLGPDMPEQSKAIVQARAAISKAESP